MLNALYSTDYHLSPLIASFINEGGLLVIVSLIEQMSKRWVFFFSNEFLMLNKISPLNYQVELLIYNYGKLDKK